jgi:hypothetical protein
MTRPRDVQDELRARLHAAVEAHEPDRARILARVERGMAAQSRPSRRATRPPLWGWARVAGATAGVAAVLAVGGYAVASVVKGDPPAQQTVTASPTPAPSPDATSRPPVRPADPAPTAGSDGSGKAGTPASKAPTASGSGTAAPPASGAQDGPLSSVGSLDPHSNDFWAQGDLTLKTSEELTALTVELKVAQTGGVSSTGAWQALPEDDFTFTVGEKDGFLVYTWVLKQGRTVPAGQWMFAAQYDQGRGGRDTREDGYRVTATAGGQQLAVKGGFNGAR